MGPSKVNVTLCHCLSSPESSALCVARRVETRIAKWIFIVFSCVEARLSRPKDRLVFGKSLLIAAIAPTFRKRVWLQLRRDRFVPRGRSLNYKERSYLSRDV